MNPSGGGSQWPWEVSYPPTNPTTPNTSQQQQQRPNNPPNNASGSGSTDLWNLSGLTWPAPISAVPSPSYPYYQSQNPSVASPAPYAVVISAAQPPPTTPLSSSPSAFSGTFSSGPVSPAISSSQRIPSVVAQNPYTYQFPQLSSAAASSSNPYAIQQQQQQLHPYQTDYWQQWMRQQQLRQQHATEYQKQIDRLKHQQQQQQQQPAQIQLSSSLVLDGNVASLLGLSDVTGNGGAGSGSASSSVDFIAQQQRELARYEALKTEREKLLMESKQIQESVVVSYPTTPMTAKDSAEAAAIAAAEEREMQDWNRRVDYALDIVNKSRAAATRGSIIDATLWHLRHQSSVAVGMSGSTLAMSSIANKSKALGSSRGVLQPVENRIDTDWLLLSEAQPNASNTPSYPSLGDSSMPSLPQQVNAFSALSLSALLPAAQSQELYSLLYADKVDIAAVKRHCRQWGIQKRVRAFVWQLILGYLPSATNQQGPTLRERRLEYYRLVESIFVRSVPASGGNPASGGLSKASRIAFNLVAVDVPRTHPDGFQLVFDTDLVRHSLERVLFVWAEQHSAVSYFQGLNDLAAMFYMVFLHAALPAGQLSDEELASSGKDINSPQMQQQLATALMAVEADVYWCMCSILDQLASQYSFNRGGVYSEQMVRSLENLLNRADPALHHHIKEVLQLDYLYFAFRWMLCLFIRELSPRNLVMLWDSFVLESGSSTTSDPGFAVLPIYIAAAYLMQLSPQISALRDSSAVLFILQKAPTDHWTKLQVHKLIASALQIKAKFPLAAVSDLGLSASINPS